MRNVQIEVASLNPQGSSMAQTVLKEKELSDLRYTDLGFAPGQVNGVQSLLNEAGDVKLDHRFSGLAGNRALVGRATEGQS